MKKLYILIILLVGAISQVKAHSVQIAYCVDCNGTLHIYVEHWHSSSANPNTTSMTIQLTVNGNPTVITQTASAAILSTPFSSLPGCFTPITSVANCPGSANYYNDWLVYDFPNLPSGVPIAFTILSGNNSEVADACGMYPLTVNFTVPTTTSTSSSFTTCQGGQTPPISIPNNVFWTNNNTATGLASSGIGSIPPFTATNAGSSIISYSNICGAVNTTLTVVPSITPSISNNTPLCVGGNLILNGSSANSYTWAGVSGFTSSIQSPTIANISTLNSGIYTLTASNAAGCIKTVTTNITINTLPVVSCSANQSVCASSPINLTGNGGQTYNWAGPNGYTSNLQNPTISNASSLNTGAYTLTATNSNGCSNTASTSVVVNTLLVVTVSANSTICIGSSINLMGAGGQTYFWTGPNSYTSTLQNATINNASTINAGTYTLTAFGSNGCSNTATTSVVVNVLPVVSAFSNSTICVGSAINLVGAGGQTYFWTGPNSYTSNLQNSNINNASATNAGTYTLTATNSNGCVNSATTSVIVNALPVVSASSNSNICVGSFINLIGAGGLTYYWTGPNSYTSNVQNPSITNTSSLNTGTYTLTATNANGCINSATTSVIVNALPVVSASSNSTSCVGAAINFTGAGGQSYYWTGPNSYTSNLQNPTISNTNSLNAGIYTLTATNANGCSNTASTTIVVSPLPDASISVNSVVCVGSSINLNGAGGLSYFWTGPNGFSAGNQNTIISNATLLNQGYYVLNVTGTNTCTKSDSVYVTVTNCTNLKEMNSEVDFEVFPNPSSNILYFKSAKINQNTDYIISLFSADGKCVLKQKYNSTLDLNALPMGLYLLTVATESKIVYTKKIIKS